MWANRSNLKYGNRKTKMGDFHYDSGLEATNGLWLEQLEKKGVIKKLSRQVSVPLICYNKDGSKSHNFGRHVVDFMVTLKDGRQKYVEIKGFPTIIWKQFKMPMTQLITDLPYLVNPGEKELLE